MRARYKTIVIDPPWPGPAAVPVFNGQAIRGDPVAVSVIPYATMTGIQVAALQILDLAAEDAQIFIWATNRSIGDAFLLLQLWAFNYRGLFIWKKTLGMGRHMRSQAEFLLWGGRVGAPLVKPKEYPPQIHEWKKPKAHSEKPTEAYQLIARLSVGPRLDIFARQRRDGFEAFGNQVGLLDRNTSE